MRLLVGLGNPGPGHAFNRHNIGYMAVDAIADRFGFSPWRARFQGLVAEGSVDNTKVLLLKPTTYMNLSGQAVGEAARFFKISNGNVIVFHDEIELSVGRVRVKQGGGSAGHNGIRSLDSHLGPDYWRVRLGVGRPGDKEQVKGHVLDNFAKTDVAWLGPLLDAVATALPQLVGGDASKFMTKVALLTSPPPVKKEKKKPEGSAPDDGAESE